MRTQRPTASNFYLQKFSELATDAGMDSSILPNPTTDGRVDATDLGHLIEAICDHTGDESMGLANQIIPRGAFFAMAKLAILEPTLGRALIVSARFMKLITNAAAPKIKTRTNLTYLQFHFAEQTKDQHHLFAELVLMSWHRLACWLIAKNIPLQNIHFEYSRPEQQPEYRYLFPGEHKFDDEWSGFTFAKHYLDESIARDFDSLKVFMRDNPVELFLQPKADFSLAADIERLIRRGSRLGSTPSIDEAATAVHVSRRTLIRRLKTEGTSYQLIKDRVRQERALELLANPDTTITEIAELVGFVDAATFSRAFKSWTGSSPSNHRAQLKKIS